MCSSPSRAADMLNRAGTVFLDGAGGRAEERRSLLFHGPSEILVARSASEIDPLLHALDREAARGRHIAGYLTYEAGEVLVFGEARRDYSGPLAWFGVYESGPDEVSIPRMDTAAVTTGIDFLPGWNRYQEAFDEVKHHIREGDVYQINLTGRGHFRWSGDPRALYSNIRFRQPVAFGSYINTGESLILSYSPELFFRRDGETIVTRPMKGTAARMVGETDAHARDVLAADPKNRAENLMIVDLLRNDLSIVCQPGSVETTNLFDVEGLPTVWQMTSRVEGKLRPEVACRDILRALFPCGSVTGAPKRRAMQIIGEVEDEPRGVYCGAIGYLNSDAAAFNVAIRTAELRDGHGVIGSGGGVVWDASAEAEFEEMHLKTRFFSLFKPGTIGPDFHLIETMRSERGSILDLSAHLDRLERSARYFDIRFARYRAEPMIKDVASTLPEVGVVRLALFASGELQVESRSLTAWPHPMRLAVFPRPVLSTDSLLYHKTSRREHYDDALEWARACGCDDALLINEKGEVTEATRGNLFVRRGGEWLTPDLMCGLLPGVFRERFIEEAPAREVRLPAPDLAQFDEIIVGNAVRGATKAKVVRA